MSQVYMLCCSDKSYYVGSTDDLPRRTKEHQDGLSDYTSKRLPVELVWSEEVSTHDQAFKLEHQIKGWTLAKNNPGTTIPVSETRP